MNKRFLLFVVMAFIVNMNIACSTTSGYTYYGIIPKEDKLLAGKEENDKPLGATCNPRQGDKAPCIVMMRPEFFKMEAEVIKLRERVKELEKGPNPTLVEEK